MWEKLYKAAVKVQMAELYLLLLMQAVLLLQFLQNKGIFMSAFALIQHQDLECAPKETLLPI